MCRASTFPDRSVSIPTELKHAGGQRHVANQYEAYKDDAKNAAKVLGLDAKSVQTIGKQSFDMVSFPEFQLDGYLPKLIRNNFRVAICDELRDPRQEEKAEKPNVEQEDEVRSNGIRR